MSTPEVQIESVNSKETLLDFIKSLQLDKLEEEELDRAKPPSPYASGAKGWNNHSIEGFLEAMHAWATDSDHLGKDPSWHTMAMLLLAGKGYE